MTQSLNSLEDVLQEQVEDLLSAPEHQLVQGAAQGRRGGELSYPN